MIDDRFTPEEFSRLMALPEDHPDRRRAAASAQFEAMRRMLGEFERPVDALLSAEQVEAASLELQRRLAAAAAPVDRVPATPDAERMHAKPPSIVARTLGWLNAPAGRVGLAFVCAVVVVGVTWWSTHRSPREEAVRGVPESGAFEIAVAHESHDGLTLHWNPVAGAEAYRVVFLGADLAEIAHVDVTRGTEFMLRRAALPAGAPSGGRVSIEVVAVRDGATVATTPARSLLLP